MTRGHRRKERDGAVRRCIATGESGTVDRLVRFALSPDGQVVPDLAGRLPGRGAWLTADRRLVEKALKKRLFNRAFRRPVEVAPDLADQLAALLTKRLIGVISMARKAGAAVTGAEKVRARINSGDAAVLIQAHDGAPGGTAKLRALANAVGGGSIASIEVLDSSELGLAFGREFAIHAALDAGGFAARACAETARLTGLRQHPHRDGTTAERMRGAALADEAAASNEDEVGPTTGAREQDDQ